MNIAAHSAGEHIECHPLRTLKNPV